jgi:hypothetical protein
MPPLSISSESKGVTWPSPMMPPPSTDSYASVTWNRRSPGSSSMQSVVASGRQGPIFSGATRSIPSAPASVRISSSISAKITPAGGDSVVDVPVVGQVWKALVSVTVSAGFWSGLL